MTDNELRAHDIAMALLMSEYAKVSQRTDKPDIVQVYKSLYGTILESVNQEFCDK